jgi:peptidoglycan-associated lipoprotein
MWRVQLVVSTMGEAGRKRGVARLALGAAIALVAFSAGLPAPRAESGPQDLLSHGLEALADDQPTEARAHFERLLKAYPKSSEASRAAKELRVLDGGDDTGADEADEVESASQQAGEAESTTLSAKASGTATQRARRAFVTAVGDRVFFAENSSSIGGRARAMLENQARWLSSHPSLKITLIGRADDGGNAAQSRDLSMLRAEAVRAKLVESGVAAAVIAIEARGATDPVATCRSPLCQAQNRLVETLITVELDRGGAGALSAAPGPAPAGGRAVSVQSRDGTLAR